MKKILLVTLLAAFSVARLHATGALSRSEAITQVESCEAVLREFMANPATAIPDPILKEAHALIIVNQVKAGLFLGIRDGYGVMLVKRANGTWSLPVILAAGEISFGLQLGVDAIETVMVLTDENTPRLLFNSRFNIGLDAKAVAGPHATEIEGYDRNILLKNPVLVYTKKRGLFAGATIKAGWLQRNDEVNFKLYNTRYTLPELLYSDWVKAPEEIAPFIDYVKQIAP